MRNFFLKISMPDPTHLATKQLMEARLELLQAEHAKEFWDSKVIKLNKRVERLRKQIQADELANNVGLK